MKSDKRNLEEISEMDCDDEIKKSKIETIEEGWSEWKEGEEGISTRIRTTRFNPEDHIKKITVFDGPECKSCDISHPICVGSTKVYPGPTNETPHTFVHWACNRCNYPMVTKHSGIVAIPANVKDINKGILN